MTNKELEAKIQELQEENEKLKATKEGTNTPMMLPSHSATPTIPYVEKEKVRVRLFRDEYRYKDPLYVSINGRNCVIRRGADVDIDKYFADFIEQQMTEEAAIWERVAQEEKEYREMSAKQV